MPIMLSDASIEIVVHKLSTEKIEETIEILSEIILTCGATELESKLYNTMEEELERRNK